MQSEQQLIEQAAESIVHRVDEAGEKPVEFDPISIISILSLLIPQLIACFNQPPKTARAYVARQYDEQTGEFSPRLVRQVKLRLRRQTRKQKLELSDEALTALAESTLQELLSTDDKTAERVFGAAPELVPDRE